ncbi:1-acylglycerol-3-phosphate O-acyltransferase [Colwellia sp. MB02u-10]|uniref:1-acylglycerol-3-phosphate O-acyltransferase n=1 Tax=Colwellia sp. MB02u-10 TaxID=2759828 RepID=UPI0015F434BF|nr:1-acylglycerol-3-phosphate O-acyltransferase [Colwellia sp. MB02u-10]MBA6342311.1 1-acylglycerol-3-phosphate O-acyltransferase [Colwellia sp. MB02u-10]
MLAVIRVILMTFSLVIICVCSILFCLIRPFHRDNVHHTANYLGKVAKILGLEVEVRIPESTKNMGPVVYICNHQNSYDIFTVSNAVQPATVSVGKKSLKWIPFFGQMYWLTGNILIDRKNKNKAMNTIDTTARKIREKKLSVWLFPEGTRSYGRGLLPFKSGAFRTAAKANVPIIPVCASNTHKTIDLNRWDNGKMIIEFLPPVYLSSEDKDKIRNITNKTRSDMLAKIEQLNIETDRQLPQVDDQNSPDKQTSEIK